MRHVAFRSALLFIATLFVASTADAKPWQWLKGKLSNSSLGLEFGYRNFMGEDEYWEEVRNEFDGDASDFSDVHYGLTYSIPINGYVEYTAGVSYFQSEQRFTNTVGREASLTGLENDFQMFPANSFENEFEFEMVPIRVLGLRFHPTQKKTIVSPFAGFGATIFWWQYRETGTFFVFNPESLDGDGNAIPGVSSLLAFENEDVEYDDAELAFDIEIGVEFYPTDNLQVGLLARYTFFDDQINRELDKIIINDQIGTSTNPNLSIQDVFVRQLSTYSAIDYDQWETTFYAKWKF